MCHSLTGFTRCYKTAAFYICPGEILEIILIKTMGVLQWRWPRVQPCHTWMRQLEVDTGLTADILLVMAYILSLMNLLLVSDFGEMTYLRMPRSVCRPNFGDISWSTTRVLLLPLLKHKRPSNFNYIFGLLLSVAVGVCFCIGLPNCMHTRYQTIVCGFMMS